MRSRLASLTNRQTHTIDTDRQGRGGRPIAVMIQTFEAEFVRVADTETWAAKIRPGTKFGIRTYLTRDGKMFRHVTNQLLFDSEAERDAAVKTFEADIPSHLDRLKAYL